MAKTRKNVNGNKKSECINTKCKLVIDEAEKSMKNLHFNAEKRIKELEKKESKDCGASTISRKCEKIKKKNLWNKHFLKQTKKSGNVNWKKIELANCATHYCNEGCKKTIFEDGPPDKLSEEFMKYLKHKELIKSFEELRKELFGNKTSVLKDGFYEGLNPKTLNKLKKEGAISGCAKVMKGLNIKRIES